MWYYPPSLSWYSMFGQEGRGGGTGGEGRGEKIINLVFFGKDENGKGTIMFYFVWIEGKGGE